VDRSLNAVSSQPRPPARAAAETDTARRLDVQGLRAVAVLLVVAFHSGLPVPGGFVGVDVFFVISGFVITAMLQREWAASGRLNFARFYLRRFKRLAPAFAVVVAITIIVSAFVLSPYGTQRVAATTAVGGVTLIANAMIATTTGGYFDSPAETNPLANIWSLSVEEQFYLIFPTLIALGWWLGIKNKRHRVSAVVCVSVVAIVSFGLTVLGSSGLGPPLLHSAVLGFYSPVVRSWEFAAGALLALVMSRQTPLSKNLAVTAGFCGVVLMSVSAWSITRAMPFPSLWTLLPVAGAALLIVAGMNGTNMVSRTLAMHPMVKLGDWSYSIYLWHWPVIVFAKLIWPSYAWAVLTAAALSFFPAIASYRWVEQPVRSYQQFSRFQFVALVAITAVVPLLLAAGLWEAATTLFWQKDASAIASEELPTGWGSPLCVSKIPVNRRDVKQCQWQTDAPGLPIYLVGDSNAMHFSDAVRNASSALNRPMTALGSDGCPLMDIFLQLKDESDFLTRCRDDYVALINWLTKSPAGLVIIGSISDYWSDQNYRIQDSKTSKNVDPKVNARKVNEGLERTVERLQRAGHAVLLLQTIPQYVEPPYTAAAAHCTGWKAMRGSCPRVFEMPRQFADNLQKASRDGIANVAAKTGSAVLDFRSFFCGEGTCSTRIDGIDMYMPDGFHLNKAGSAELTQTFIDSIKSLKPAVSIHDNQQ